jgi:hypothetical protein
LTNKNNIFDIRQIEKIKNLFSTEIVENKLSYTFNLKNLKTKSNISVEILPESDNLLMISVYTNNCHLQLQSCDRIIISDMLEEVLFLSRQNEKISGLIISKQGDCSLYSNVDVNIFKNDFAKLESEKLISAVALSVSETVY